MYTLCDWLTDSVSSLSQCCAVRVCRKLNCRNSTAEMHTSKHLYAVSFISTFLVSYSIRCIWYWFLYFGSREKWLVTKTVVKLRQWLNCMFKASSQCLIVPNNTHVVRRAAAVRHRRSATANRSRVGSRVTNIFAGAGVDMGVAEFKSARRWKKKSHSSPHRSSSESNLV